MWDRNRKEYLNRLFKIKEYLQNDKFIEANDLVTVLSKLICSGDRVCIEGDNQKQAIFLATALSQLDPQKVNHLHMIQSAIALPEHLDIFEKGIANRIDFSYSGPQSVRLANMVKNNKIEIGNIHTYNELFGRLVADLTPNVCLLMAEQADQQGNLFTGANTEETPAIIEATNFRNGIVIVQVNELVDRLPRVDIPGDWVDIIVKGPEPSYIEPLFTRDPAQIDEIKILMAMMVIKGIYAPYQVNILNHGVGFNTCAIELLLPTYAESLGLKGKIAQHWIVNPLPTLIPAIEAGFVKSIYPFGGEVGMNRYAAARPDVFFTGKEGCLRSNRMLGQLAGHYACDVFIGATLQMDLEGNSSTAVEGRIAGFGGAPNMGCDAPGRRHSSYAWLRAGKERSEALTSKMPRGRKLVIQMVETFQSSARPTFVEKLDAWELQKSMNADLPAVMIYGDDVSHIVTEEGIANLLMCQTMAEREQAIRGIAGYTAVGMKRNKTKVEELRQRGIIKRPEDLGIKVSDATRDLLAAKSIRDLVDCSHGLYEPPAKFRNW
ncbi:malonate decarboxylase subunit alpha [Legionella longbeachae]|uniref:Malonate decarboxylase, alpha subunit n=1 Tax=Legionella longbeachae serogroup 1 (strain NSW150) TaxID=661367 RepID=D3HKK3_LEGLN|nr:malonate decarboxylase subunit alpha [Legionella longbeachae]VEE03486.1 malonate decarboxylase subunit alpha [Legionella oakridgensis]HBD7397763.1 malonate decarboxylase subunit alpha [Legionella pneumophila]ARB93622.1 malonate decarboxylase subunit alpha [Legionella longbeachae]ARM33237.1 malonate decarboxylase subunit alpha [Legionella longbeachae]EEZ93903.1 malonate decarboxylase alpha subunit [Legionella longbeachae D-4968]